jgi:hypothetical protein
MNMSLPRILWVVPGLLAGLLLPSVVAEPKTPPASAVGMVSQMFARPVVTVPRGDQLELVNNSRLVHVIGPGRGGHVISPASGVPVLGLHLMQTNSVYRTGPWKTPGTYSLTCPVHPEMTLEVVVTH